MDRDLANRCHVSCVALRNQTPCRGGSWYGKLLGSTGASPLLASRAGARGEDAGVCSKQTFEDVVTHWLNHANLQLVAGGASPWLPAVDTVTGVQRLCLLHGAKVGVWRTGGAARVPFTGLDRIAGARECI